MNKENLKKALEKSDFISDPETMHDLLSDADNILQAAYPGKIVTPQAMVALAYLMLYFEDGAEMPEETEE